LVRWKGFTAEGNTWESRENLENAGDLLKEFEEEYGRDGQEVRRQEKEEDNRNYWKRGFPGRFTAGKLYGWNNRRYDREYWDRMDRNWRKWKGTRPLGRRRLDPIREVREEKEYQGRKIEEWDEEDQMGCMGDEMGEL